MYSINGIWRSFG